MIIVDNDAGGLCPNGCERYETFWYELAKEHRVQYFFRTPEGTLFSTVAKTVEAARARRDLWLESRKIGAIS